MDAFVNTMTSAAAAVAGLADQINDLKLGKKQYNYYVQGLEKSAELQHKENQFWADYNTPASQMQRLKAAGLNPNLVYDNGANAQFSGSVSPHGSMPSFKGEYGKNLIAMQNLMAQNENLKRQNDLLAAQTDKTYAESENIRQNMPADVEAKRTQALYNLSQVEKNDVEKSFLYVRQEIAEIDRDIKREFGSDTARAQLNGIDIANQIADINKSNLPRILEADYNLKHSQARELVAKISVYNAQVRQINKQIEVLNEQKQLMEKQGKVFDEQAYKTKLEKEAVGLNNYAKQLQIYLDKLSLPASVINRYMTPANIAVSAMSTFGININGAVRSLMDVSPVPSPLLPSEGSDLSPIYNQYY